MSRRSPRPGGGAVTIAEVARESGFSSMTVSRVMNGEKSVRDATRRAVIEVVERLNYSPNPAARTLAGADLIRIGLLYSNPSAAYLSRFLVGSLEQARRSHVQLVIEACATEIHADEAVGSLISGGVDGIILSPPLCDSEELIARIVKEGVPAVLIANWRPQNISVIRIDDVEAAATMMRHIIQLGHRRVGFIKGNPVHKASCERLIGFKAALREAAIELDPALVVDGQFTYRSGLIAAERLLNVADRPTAIFAANDDMAAAAITIAHRRHLDVPDDLTVCGFDDTDFAQSIWPELTTIHQPIADMARAAIDLLVEQIRCKRSGDDVEVVERLLDYHFVQRGSDGPPKS